MAGCGLIAAAWNGLMRPVSLPSCRAQTIFADGREAAPVGRPAFKAGWGCSAAPGGFDSRSLPPCCRRAEPVALGQHCAQKPLYPLALTGWLEYGWSIERA